jgi:predicted TIM-barrel fold metal-dependent hydrolase
VIIDTHVHPLSDDRQRYPLAPGASEPPDWHNQVRLTADDCLEQMERAGVDKMVLVSSYTAYGHDSSFAADAAAQHPDRFVGVCRIDGRAPDAPDVLSRWVEERGMRGVRLQDAGREVDPTCERALALGIPVAFQVSHREIGNVRRVAERFPDLIVILDHLAHPPLEDGPPYAEASEFFALADCPNLHLKFSTLNIREASRGKSRPGAFIQALVNRFGPDRVMWGSDFPHSTGSPAAPYTELVDLARDVVVSLSPAEREQVFAGTARRLFPALASP